MSVYWEKQGQDELCGVHCLNSLLQGPFFDAVDLAKIAIELDAKENALMGAQKGPSSNVAESGNYSIQVIEKALSTVNLFCKSISSQVLANQELSDENGFICNAGGHWYSLRKVDNVWYYLNSLGVSGPSSVSSFYLSAMLSQFSEQGNQIFLVLGEYPYNKKLIDKKGLNDDQKLFLPEDIPTFASQQKQKQNQNDKINLGNQMEIENEESSYWKVLQNNSDRRYNTRLGGQQPKFKLYDPQQDEGRFDDEFDEDYMGNKPSNKKKQKQDNQANWFYEEDYEDNYNNGKNYKSNNNVKEGWIELSIWLTHEIRITDQFSLKSKVSQIYDLIRSKNKTKSLTSFVLYCNLPETRYFSQPEETLESAGLFNGIVLHLMKL